MKRIFFLCLLIVLGYTVEGQSVKVKRIKKIPLKQEAFDPSFGEKSHQILLSRPDQEFVSVYNTRSRREKPAPEAEKASISELARVNGKKIELILPGADPVSMAPVGDFFYIWVSVSPDGSRLLFTAAGKGTFVTDLEGNIIKELGYLNAPTWMNNNWVLGMNDQDDGHKITSSDIIAVHLPSESRKNLTGGSDEIALDPKASISADRIVFQNGVGDVFIMKIRIRD